MNTLPSLMLWSFWDRGRWTHCLPSCYNPSLTEIDGHIAFPSLLWSFRDRGRWTHCLPSLLWSFRDRGRWTHCIPLVLWSFLDWNRWTHCLPSCYDPSGTGVDEHIAFPSCYVHDRKNIEGWTLEYLSLGNWTKPKQIPPLCQSDRLTYTRTPNSELVCVCKSVVKVNQKNYAWILILPDFWSHMTNCTQFQGHFKVQLW